MTWVFKSIFLYRFLSRIRFWVCTETLDALLGSSKKFKLLIILMMHCPNFKRRALLTTIWRLGCEALSFRKKASLIRRNPRIWWKNVTISTLFYTCFITFARIEFQISDVVKSKSAMHWYRLWQRGRRPRPKVGGQSNTTNVWPLMPRFVDFLQSTSKYALSTWEWRFDSIDVRSTVQNRLKTGQIDLMKMNELEINRRTNGAKHSPWNFSVCSFRVRSL